MDLAAEAAKDRPKYVADFFRLWEGTAKNVSSVADDLLQNQSVDGLTKECWNSLLAPYEVLPILRFRYIMDRMELEEEERYLAACAALDQAWQKFFSTILVRHPDLSECVARLEAARQQAHDATVPLFTGEANPVLTPAWGRAMMTLEDGRSELAEGLGK